MKRSLCIILGVMMLFSGCGKKTEEIPELIEPVGKSISETAVVKTDLYKTTVINGEIVPDVTQYAFSANGRLTLLNVSVGDYVKVGDILAEVDETNAQAELSLVTDESDEIREYYDNEIGKLKDLIAKGVSWQDKELYELMISQYEGMKEQKLSTLDERMEIAEKKLKQTKLVAEKEGYVTAINCWPGRTVYQDRPVIAVANDDKHFLICDAVDKDLLKDAVSVCTIIDGKVCPAVFLTDDAEESPSYSYFTVNNKGLKSGDYAPLIIVSNLKEGVTAVPNTCLFKDEGGKYVYVVSDGTRVKTYVTVGETGLNYTEIESGLKEGDMIYLKEEVASSSGNSVSTFRGDLVLTSRQRARVNYLEQTALYAERYQGSLTFRNFTVGTFEMVKKGDVIAYYEETVDEDYMAECLFSLELYKLRKDAYNTAYYENLIEEMNEGIGTRSVKAPYDGMIINMESVYNGSDVPGDGKICTFASVDSLLLSVDNSSNAFRYGQTVTVEATISGKNVIGTGRVITASKTGLGEGMQTNTAFIKLDEGYEYLYFGSSIYATSENVSIKDIVLVDVNAVKTSEGVPYVVSEENGLTKRISFVTGRKGSEYYWAADGIGTGITITY